MANYFVNPLGSDTSPFDTRAKGASTFKGLLDNIVQADSDRIKVADGGEIDDTGFGIPNITKNIVIEPDSANTSKPIVKVAPANAGFSFLLNSNQIEVHDLIIKKYGTPSEKWIYYNPSSPHTLIIDGCYIWGENQAVAQDAKGIWLPYQVNFIGTARILRTEFFNTYDHVYENAGGGS